jgi:hypothetical protein
VVEHSLGKGEVESSILSCSTISHNKNSVLKLAGLAGAAESPGMLLFNPLFLGSPLLAKIGISDGEGVEAGTELRAVKRADY